MLILDDEDHVETGQDGWHEVDVVLPLCVVPATEHGVSSSEHGAAGVEGGGDAGLGGVRMLVRPVIHSVQRGNCDVRSVNTLAMEMVCCSMASWMATLSSSLI